MRKLFSSLPKGALPASEGPARPDRRAALRRLAGAMVAAYVVPEMVVLSAARAGQSGSGGSNSLPSTTSGPSFSSASFSGASLVSGPGASVSVPSASAPSASGSETPSASAPERTGNTDRSPGDSCNISGPSGASGPSFSRSDISRAQEAISAGYARPLEQIWNNFKSQYNGRIIGVKFTGRRRSPQYRFRAISRTGRLETVTISAQTGDILRIVGC